MAEGEPALANEPSLNDRAPENEHIHAGVAALCRGVLRHGERRLRRRRPPGLDPGHTAGFQFGDDLVGDFGIEARPVLAGTGASGVSGHRGSPRRAPRASLATFNPSRETRPALSLSGALRGTPRRRGCAGDLGAGQGEGVPLRQPHFLMFAPEKLLFTGRHSASERATVLLHKRLKDGVSTILVKFDADLGPKVVRKVI